MEAVGSAAGRNLTFAAQKLQEVSGHALSADASMRVMALGVSSGFSTDQMERLTVVAKGASAALGRNLTDALDRLTRGTAKLEPEILDELGIMVRLDDATREYATQIGKTADELTEFERKQAFLNATLEQGEKKFGALAETLDPNPYDQLAASMSNLLKTFLKGANEVLVPMINLLSGSMTAMAGAALLFGSTISRQVLPFLYGAAGAAKETAISLAGTSREFAIAKLGALTTGGALAKYGAALATGTEDEKKLASAIKGSNKQIKNREVIIAAGTDAQGNMNAAATKAKAELDDLHVARKSLNDMEAEGAKTRHASAKANALEAVSRGKLITGFKELNTEIGSYHTNNKDSLKSSSTAAKGLNGLRTAGYAAGTALRFVGTGFLAMLGPIGLILSVGAMVIPMLTDMFKKPKTELEKVQEEIEESFSNIGKISDSVMASLERFGTDTAESMVAGFRAMRGVMNETAEALRNLQQAFEEMNESAMRASRTRQRALQATVDDITSTLEKTQKRMDEIREDGGPQGRGSEFYNLQIQKTQNALALNAAQAALDAEVKIFKDAEKEKNAFAKEATMQLLEDRIKAIKDTPMFEAGVGSVAVKNLENLLSDVTNNLIKTPEELEKRLHAITTPLNTIVDGFDTAQQDASQLFGALNELAQREETRYSKSIQQMETMIKKSHEMQKALEAEGAVGEGLDEVMGEYLKLNGAVKLFGEEQGRNLTGMEAYIKETKELETGFIKGKETIKTLQKETKILEKLAKRAGTPEGVLAFLDKQEELREERLDQVEREIKLEKRLGDATITRLQNEINEMDKSKEKDKAILDLNEKIAEFKRINGDLIEKENRLKDEALTKDERSAHELLAMEQTLKKMVALDAQLVSLGKQRLANLQKTHEANLVIEKAQSGRGLTMGLEASAGDNLRTFFKFVAERRRIAKLEFELAKTRFQLEHDLLIAKNFLLKKELEAQKVGATIPEQNAIDKIVTSLDAYPEKLGLVLEAQKATAKTLLDAQLKSLDAEKEKLQLANLRVLVGEKAGTGEALGKGGKGVFQFSKKLVQAVDAAGAKAQQNYLKQRVEAYKNFGMTDALALESAEVDLSNKINLGTFDVGENLTGFDKMTTAMAPMAAMFQQMAEMGGENSNVFSALGDTMTMLPDVMSQMGAGEDGGAFDQLNKLLTGKDMGDGETGVSNTIQGIAAGIGAVAAVLSSVYKIKAAQTADNIAQIDREIAAVKKLGGTTESKEKKIMALEKKKEALKKKQFNDQKKMMMAQALMGIALGVINALSLKPPINFIMAGIVAALGAAQLAIISGMTYQGGGTSASAPSGPKGISMGERSNKVDVSRSNVGGELAYMRGERGQGSGASNFTPAFTGYRHRATGGAAYVVGEQGPELFVPEVPGQIVPNDEIGGAAANITANFNIQTIDATTMEETLTTQRGNIINMIREAANNSGEQFLESVDTLGLQTEEGVV